MAQKHKKTPEGKDKPNKPVKNPLSPADIERFREALLEKRKEIVGNVNEMEDEALKKSRLDASGDLSSMPIHMADIGTDNYEQEFALGLMDSEIKLLKEIDDALQRIADNTYGICEGTGQPIAKARLEAQPWARYCMEYARTIEQGSGSETEQSTSEPLDYENEEIEEGEEEEEEGEERGEREEKEEEAPEDAFDKLDDEPL